jgi:hypothetical protein
MFDFTKEKMEKENAEHMARGMFADMVAEAILESESTPEHMKLCVGILLKGKDISKAMHEINMKYVTSGNEADTETLKKIMEYLQLVELGIKQFVETTPFAPNTEEE